MRQELMNRDLRVIDEPEEIDYLTDFVVASNDPQLSMAKLTRPFDACKKGPNSPCPTSISYIRRRTATCPDRACIAAAVSYGREGARHHVGQAQTSLTASRRKKYGLPTRPVFDGRRFPPVGLPGGGAAGMPSLLVLSGGVTEEQIDKAELKPTFVADSGRDVPACWEFKAQYKKRRPRNYVSTCGSRGCDPFRAAFKQG